MDALEIRFYSQDLKRFVTVREFLKTLLMKMFTEREFNGKRPFGSSSWDGDLFIALIRDGKIHGTIDSDGFISEIDWREAREYVTKEIIPQL